VQSDAYLFPIRPAVRWAGSSGTFRANERDWIAPNPPPGAWINLYLKSAPKTPVTVTIADKAGRTVRTLRPRGEAGVNRIVWNLRHNLPGEPAAGAAGGPGALASAPPAGGRGGAPQGPAVAPGEYTVKVEAAGRTMNGIVKVTLDPGVQAAAADLDAQAQASFQALSLAARVTSVIERVDAMLGQLATLDAQLAKQTPSPAARRQVTQAIETLRTFKDEELARPVPGMGYRQYPRLREDVQSLAGYLGRGFRAPNAGELERMKDLTVQVDQAVAKVNGIIAKDITAINEAVKASPRIVVEPIR
jgi:hypothetical protein